MPTEKLIRREKRRHPSSWYQITYAWRSAVFKTGKWSKKRTGDFPLRYSSLPHASDWRTQRITLCRRHQGPYFIYL